MADVKISALTAVAAAAATNEIPMNEAGTTKKVTVAQLFTAPSHASYDDFTAIADPAAPAASTVRIYAKNVSGRIVPKWKGPSGLDTPMQAALSANSVTMWLPGGTTTASIAFGTIWTVGATQATPAIAATNVMTSIKRATFATTTTSGSAAGIRAASPCAIASSTAGLGGFFFAARGGILTYQSAMEVWFGLSSTGNALAGDPSAVLNSAGFTKDSGETVWQFCTTDGSTNEKTSSGRTTAAGGSAEVFDFYMFAAPGSLTITGRMVDITTDTVLVDNVAHSTHVPVTTTLLYPIAYVRAGSAAAVSIFLSKIYVESDN